MTGVVIWRGTAADGVDWRGTVAGVTVECCGVPAYSVNSCNHTLFKGS